MSTRRSPEARCWRAWLAVALAAVAMQAAAASPGPATAERWRVEQERIQRERAQVDADARAAEAQCMQQFVVAGCVKQVRADRRAKLQLLDRQRALIDDEQRRQRAADRLERIRNKQAQQAIEASKPALEVKTRGARVPAEPPKNATPLVDSDAKAAAAQAAQAKAAARAAAAQRRAQAADAHRSAVEQRNKERESRRSPGAKPLPVPPAASLPAP